MDSRQLDNLIQRKAREIRAYANSRFPTEAGNTALRFINQNFKQQGWQGASLEKWKKNKRKRTVLIKTGHLRSASYYVTGAGSVTIRNTMPYAKIHNEGGKIQGTAKIGSHSRRAHVRKGGIRVRAHSVTAHTRVMNIEMPQRQFAPTPQRGSPVLNKAIQDNIKNEFERIFNN